MLFGVVGKGVVNTSLGPKLISCESSLTSLRLDTDGRLPPPAPPLRFLLAFFFKAAATFSASAAAAADDAKSAGVGVDGLDGAAEAEADLLGVLAMACDDDFSPSFGLGG